MSNSYLSQRNNTFASIYDDIINSVSNTAGKNWDKYKKIIDYNHYDTHYDLATSIILNECEYIRNNISNDFMWKLETDIEFSNDDEYESDEDYDIDPFCSELYLMMEQNETYFFNTIFTKLSEFVKLLGEEQIQRMNECENKQNEKIQARKISTKAPTNKNSTYHGEDGAIEHFDFE